MELSPILNGQEGTKDIPDTDQDEDDGIHISGNSNTNVTINYCDSPLNRDQSETKETPAPEGFSTWWRKIENWMPCIQTVLASAAMGAISSAVTYHFTHQNCQEICECINATLTCEK